jgi:hypothetical protein
MPAALSVLKTRNFSKMFLRARRLLEFSHGLGHERRFRDLRGTSAYPPRLAVKADIPDSAGSCQKLPWAVAARQRLFDDLVGAGRKRTRLGDL